MATTQQANTQHVIPSIWRVLFQNPHPYFVFTWAVTFITALAVPLYNFFLFKFPEDRAPNNWAFWVLLLLAAMFGCFYAIQINQVQMPSPPPPKPSKWDLLKSSLRPWALVLIPGIVAIVILIYGGGHFLWNEEFKRHRSQVEQLECKDQIHAFLRDSTNLQAPSNNVCAPELIAAPLMAVENQGVRCVASQPIEKEYSPLKWVLGVGNYMGAVGKTSIVFNNNSIKATSSWLLIASPWYKDTGTKRVETIARGDLTCQKTCKPPILTRSVKETSHDNILKATAAIKRTPNTDHIEVDVSTQLFANPPGFLEQLDFGVFTIDPSALLDGLSLDSTPSTTTIYYECEHLPLQKK